MADSFSRHSESRVLPLSGVHNFRDYGGYATKDGGRVKTGLLYRSGQHGEASEQDLQAIDALALAHVVDLRGEGERQRAPCRRGPGFAAQVHVYEGETAALAPHEEAAGGVLDEAGAYRAMTKLYSRLPERRPLLTMLRRYFDVLAAGEGASLVHCHAGKDRTGMAVDFLHHALGVHPDDAMEDFLLTNSAGNIDARLEAGRRALSARWGDIDDATIRVLMGVDARYLEASRKAVTERYGSIDAFLEQELGVDNAKRDALRLHLVET